jgi:hypothetical protein
MWTAFWGALWAKLLGFLEAWQQRRERDALVQETTQDDARIADQAAALRVLRAADSVPRELTPDATGAKPARRGRRE